MKFCHSINAFAFPSYRCITSQFMLVSLSSDISDYLTILYSCYVFRYFQGQHWFITAWNCSTFNKDRGKIRRTRTPRQFKVEKVTSNNVQLPRPDQKAAKVLEMINRSSFSRKELAHYLKEMHREDLADEVLHGTSRNTHSWSSLHNTFHLLSFLLLVSANINNSEYDVGNIIKWTYSAHLT